MKKIFLLILSAFLIIAVTVFAVPGKKYDFDASTESARIRCVTQFGWEIDPVPVEIQSVEIPSPLGAVYEEYNTLQKEIGLDLSQHSGEEAVRYTYNVLNHADKKGRKVRADIIVSDGRMIAGDIMVTALDGYMHAINRKK